MGDGQRQPKPARLRGALPRRIAGRRGWQLAVRHSCPASTKEPRSNTLRRTIRKLIQYIRNPRLAADQQRRQFQLLQRINARHHWPHGPGKPNRSSYAVFEMAYRMQTEATEAFDVRQEPEHILKMYGDGPQNRQLLIARRLVERGVRFVQTWHGGGQPWDSQANIKNAHRNVANQCDQGLAA